MPNAVRDVVIIGAGISGLTAAWRLKQAGLDVCLLEAGEAVGGCARTCRRDGFLLEHGPFNVIVRDPAFEALLDEFCDEVNVVTASRSARTRFIYRAGRLHTVPTGPAALLTTQLLSGGARRRLLSGLIWSPSAPPAEQTIQQAAARRFGREVADVLVSAAAAGIFAGDFGRLSLAACFPGIARIDAAVRSPAGYALASLVRRKKHPARRRWRGLVSFDGGVGALAEALRKSVSPDVQPNCRVHAVRFRDGRYDVRCSDPSGTGRTIQCQRIVIATPVSQAARLLRDELPRAAALLGGIDSVALAIVNLGFGAGDVGHPLNAFGFLVPRVEAKFPLLGVIFADSVFPQYAPPGFRLLRVFIGGAADPDAVDRTDEELVETAVSALRRLLRLSGDPALVAVFRHRAAIPQYHLGHAELIASVQRELARRPGLHLTGNYLEGVSINACVRHAAAAADAIIRETDSGHSADRFKSGTRVLQDAAPAGVRG